MTRGRVVSAVLLSAMASLLLSSCATFGSSTPTTTGHTRLSACTTYKGLPRLVLSYKTSRNKLSVHVGEHFFVSVPPWHWGHDTDISISHPGVVKRVCSIGLNDGGRWSEFKAVAVGRAVLGATVTPASNLFMPEWLGHVVVSKA